MARGHAEALAPMVEEVMRGLDGGFASLSRSRSRPVPALHRHPRRPGDGAGDGGGARNSRGRRFDSWPRSPRRCSARPGPELSPRRSTPGTARSISSCSNRPAARWGRRAAIRLANAFARSAPARHGLRDAAALIANEAQRAGLPYDLDAARNAPDIVALAWMGLAVDPATSPARPIYVKPPDARPNPAEPIARAPV